MEKFTLQQRLFLYDSYVKCNSARKSQRKFEREFPGVRVPTRYAIHYLVNKVRKTGVLRDSKPRRRRRVLTEEKLDEIGALFEESPRKSLKRIAQETGVSIKTVRTARELLQLWPYETGRRCVEEQNENFKSRSPDSTYPLVMKVQMGSMVHVEGEREENFVKQEPGVCVENTKKPASKECRQNFEYVDVTSIKTETDYITKEEPGECFEKLGFDMIKEEVEDEVSVQKNSVSLEDVEANSLHNDESVKQEDTSGDCGGIPANGSEIKTHFCKCEVYSISSEHLSCSRNDSQIMPHKCCECGRKV